MVGLTVWLHRLLSISKVPSSCTECPESQELMHTTTQCIESIFHFQSIYSYPGRRQESHEPPSRLLRTGGEIIRRRGGRQVGDALRMGMNGHGVPLKDPQWNSLPQWVLLDDIHSSYNLPYSAFVSLRRYRPRLGRQIRFLSERSNNEHVDNRPLGGRPKGPRLINNGPLWPGKFQFCKNVSPVRKKKMCPYSGVR